MRDILTIIRNRTSTRSYKSKRVERAKLLKIINSGIWGPSVPSFLGIQPWYFIVVTNKKQKQQLGNLISTYSKKAPTGVNILVNAAASIILKADVAMFIFKSNEMKNVANKYKTLFKSFEEVIKMAELSAIAATIQNMILTAESLGIGSCWLDTPLFCRKEIGKVLKMKDELVAVLTLGYAKSEGRRSPRKPCDRMFRFN